MLRLSVISGVLAAAALSSSAPFSSALADHDPRQGEQVRSICFGQSINGFKTLKGEDDVVLLEKGVNDWYLVELSGPCGYRSLKWAQAVSINSRGGGCLGKGDFITFHDSAFGERDSFDRRCFVSAIYEWDEDAVADDDESEDSGEESDED